MNVLVDDACRCRGAFCGRTLPSKWSLPCVHAVQHDAQRVSVGGRGDRASGNLLGRHVERCSDSGTEGQVAGDIQNAGDAEVGNQHGVVLVDQHIRRFQVPVNNTLIVSVLERRDNGSQVADRGIGFEDRIAGRENIFERFARDVIEQNEEQAVKVDDVVVAHDMRVLEPGKNGCFALKPAVNGRIAGNLRPQDFGARVAAGAGL